MQLMIDDISTILLNSKFHSFLP